MGFGWHRRSKINLSDGSVETLLALMLAVVLRRRSEEITGGREIGWLRWRRDDVDVGGTALTDMEVARETRPARGSNGS